MTKYISITFITGFLTLNVFAQNKERVIGVYRSSLDFISGKLSYSIDCSGRKNRIKLNDLFFNPFISIHLNDSSFNIPRKTLFGYKTCNDQIYRFMGNTELLLLNPREEISIYKFSNPKISEGAKINVTNKYFSMPGDSSLQKLTIANLKRAFMGNNRFQTLIDLNFKYNMELGTYDAENHIYKINFLLRQSVN